MMKMSAEVLQEALTTFQITKDFDGDTDAAVEAALKVAIQKMEPLFIHQAAQAAREYAEQLAEEREPDVVTDDFRASLLWFAEKFEKEDPVSSRVGNYHPTSGDVVEVTLRGEVEVHAMTCGHGHAVEGTEHWSVETDNGTWLPFDFDDVAELEVRVITRDAT